VGGSKTSEARRETVSFDSRGMIKPEGWQTKAHTVDLHKSPRSGLVGHLLVLIFETFERLGSLSLGLGRAGVGIALLLVVVFVVRVKVCADVVPKLVVIIKRSHSGWDEAWRKGTDGRTEGASKVADLT
jgi:hypothetical protein